MSHSVVRPLPDSWASQSRQPLSSNTKRQIKMHNRYYLLLKQRVTKLIVLGDHREKRVIYLTNLITNKLRKIITEERKDDRHYFSNSTHLEVEVSGKPFDLDDEPYGGNSMGVYYIHFTVGYWFSKLHVRVTV